MDSQPYDDGFFAEQRSGSLSSARAMMPTILRYTGASSIVDLGCGVGTWLRAAMDEGVTDVVGIDGDYIDRTQLEIPEELFRSRDLGSAISLERRFDLAVSLEVAEHLPEGSANQFISNLTGASDVVLFSAAIPRQGGTNHINERWQSWWAERFGRRGYVPLDLFRSRFWTHPGVVYHYAQNMFLYVLEDRVRDFAGLDHQPLPLDVVHPHLYEARSRRPEDLRLRDLVAALPASVRRAIANRIPSTDGAS